MESYRDNALRGATGGRLRFWYSNQLMSPESIPLREKSSTQDVSVAAMVSER